MILYEATSALDARTERQVRQAIGAAMHGRTTFVNTHPIATIRNADRILVFDRGRIIESGTFDELVAQNGAFAAFARAAQFMTGARAGSRVTRERVRANKRCRPIRL